MMDFLVENLRLMANETVDLSKKIPQGYEPNFVERWWLSLFEGRNEWVVFTLVAFIMHELVYFGRYVPFWVCDYIPALQKYKIQQNKLTTNEMQFKCLKKLLFCHFVIEAPLMVGFLPVARYFGIETTEVPFPALKTMALQIAVFFVLEDFWHYWIHRLFHYGPLYRYVHKVHHEFSAPFGIVAEYAHPAETIIFGQGTILSPLLYCKYVDTVHAVTMLLWIWFRLFQAIDAHSGYDFPWSLHNFLPFWAGADHHDYHHMAFVSNFSSSFRWWDTIFGTDTKYHEYKRRLAEKQKKA
ncbi:C-4 sterol methyl oxidase [Spiromyces aspiralis]|uniref:C-4 sterol methyl oxidase n=1 Tax=Spiromyces aspiralis TaxID=68401 RepID=A0ACC1HFY6_9FUNG|nr:C-4 sterol methyl oxidase [Spiromyces aspiralis]